MRIRLPLRTLPRLALIACFVAGLALPLAGWWLLPQQPLSQAEQRRLAPRPALVLEPAALAAYPKRFEAFYNDHYGFRDTLVRWHNALKVRVLGISPTPRVIIGDGGWLFWGAGAAVDNYRPQRAFTPAELARWQQVLQARHDWLAARGIRYLVVIVPEKHTVYPEHLPAAVRQSMTPTRLDQLVARLRADSSVAVLDLRAALTAAKAQGRVYLRTDTHWTELGAYAGYRAIVARLARWFPALAPAPREAFTPVSETTPGGNLARMLDAQSLYSEVRPGLAPLQPRQAREADPGPLRAGLLGRNAPRATERGDPALPRAVMFRDSYTTALIPFLSEHFRRIVYVWHWAFDPEVVERERPDVVIRELGERALWVQTPANPRPVRPPGARSGRGSAAGSGRRPETRQ